MAGFSAAYLSMIENGKSPVDKRSTFEAFATVLKVASSELGSPFPPSGHPDDAYVTARSAIADVEEVLTDVEVGEATRAPAEWPDITRRARRPGMAGARGDDHRIDQRPSSRDRRRGPRRRRATLDDAVTALLRAEELVPQRIRAHPLIRETVTHLLRRTRRDDAVGRELRGMAYRMGIAG